jgi:hypothetical protein
MLQQRAAPALAAREEALQSLQIQEPKQTRLVPAQPQERVREFQA